MRRVHPANETPRCFVCGTHLRLCFCADLPRHATRTRIVFVQHAQETFKPTNSARMACRILSDALIVPWSRTAPPDFPEGAILLYPGAGAAVLEARDLAESATVVVPDGTWSQAARIANVLDRDRLRPRTLPPGGVLSWTVRRGSVPERISSGQAAAQALLLAGETDAARSLHAALEEAQRRILSVRGVLPTRPDSQDGPT